MNQLIAFTGIAGSGKSTAAQAIERLDYTRMSFATPLRAMLLGFGLTREQLFTKKTETIPWIGKSPRELMQTLGTEWGRQMVHPDIWVMLAQRVIENHRITKSHGIVFDDCRFDNEAKMIKAMGGIVVSVDRDSTKRMSHASEAGVSAEFIDFRIGNIGDRVAFQNHALAVLNAL